MARRIQYLGDPALSVPDVIEWLRESEDTIQTAAVNLIVPAVTAQCEEITGAAIRLAVYEETWPWPFRVGQYLDVGQVRRIVSIHRLDSGEEVPESAYSLLDHGRQSALHFHSALGGGVRIRYEAGIDLALHPDVKSWLLMQAASLYAQRETLTAGGLLHALPAPFLVTMLSGVTVPPRF